MEDFATISKLRNECTGLRNGTRVPKGGFAAAKHPAKLGYGCENWRFHALGISQPFRSCEMELLCCEMALVCQEVVSQLRKFSQRGGMGLGNHFATKWCFPSDFLGLRNGFAAKWRFRNELVGATKWFRRKGPISQRLLLGCEISQTPVFTLFLAPNNFPSISLQFLLILTIKKD